MFGILLSLVTLVFCVIFIFNKCFMCFLTNIMNFVEYGKYFSVKYYVWILLLMVFCFVYFIKGIRLQYVTNLQWLFFDKNKYPCVMSVHPSDINLLLRAFEGLIVIRSRCVIYNIEGLEEYCETHLHNFN